MKSALAISLFLFFVAASVLASNADPLPVGREETWFLYETGPEMLRAERRNWRTEKTVRYDVPLPPRDSKGNRRLYAMASNSAGLWVVDSSLLLLRPNGTTHRIDLFQEPPDRGMSAYEGGDQKLPVALDDGSLLLLVKLRGETKGKAFRVRWTDSSLKLQQIADTPGFNYGISAARLADGRVLVVGGYTSQNQSWIFDPRSSSWAASGNTSVSRMHPALAALPDGSAFIAGGSWLSESNDRNGGRLAVVYGAEIWSPKTNRWIMLPSLPMSFKVNAYGAQGPFATAMPDGSPVIGGGMHRHFAVLNRQGEGFAPYWMVSEPMASMRVGAVLQVTGKDTVQISGGRTTTGTGQCCMALLNSEPLTVPAPNSLLSQSATLLRNDVAVANRGDFTFSAGGWETFYLSSQETQASAVAELINNRTGQVRQLPPLPQPLLTGNAEWLDDDRIVVKAVAHAARYEQPFRKMDGRSLEADFRGFLAVFSIKDKTWKSVDDPRLQRATLAGAINDSAILIGNDVQAWKVDLNDLAARSMPSMISSHESPVARVLPDGRVVVAGGLAQSQLIQAIDADCDRPECPIRDFGYGALTPARYYEVFSPDTRSWRVSSLSSGGSASAVIDSSGRVVSIGLIETAGKDGPARWLVEESDEDGKKWRRLSWPNELAADGCGNHFEPKCILLAGRHPATGKDIIFLIHNWWSSADREDRHDIWVLADDRRRWTRTDADLRNWELLSKKVLIRRLGSQVLFGSRFVGNKLRLWLE